MESGVRVRMAAGALVGAAMLLVGCSPHVPAAETPSAVAVTAHPAPVERSGLIAVLDAPLGAVPNTVRLIRSDGTELAHGALPEDAEAVTLAGHRVLVAGGGRLRSLSPGPSGMVDQGPLPDTATDEEVRGLVASPDGRSWIWASLRRGGDGILRSRIHLAGADSAARVVLERSRPDSALQPVLWTAVGPVVADEPVGIGGYVLFRRAFGPSSRLDLATGALTPLSDDACAVGDISSLGTLACVRNGREGSHDDTPVSLRIAPARGAAIEVRLPATVAQAGAAYFTADGTRLTLATSPARADGTEEIRCAIVDALSGTVSPIGTDGLTPAGWISADTFVAVRTPGAGGGDPGTFLIRTDGRAIRLAMGSTVVGVHP